MIDYRIDLYNNGVKKAELDSLINSITYGEELNDFVVGNFSMNGNNLPTEIIDNLVAGAELRIFRRGENDSELRLVYAAEISRLRIRFTDQGAQDNSSSIGSIVKESLINITGRLVPKGLTILKNRKITKTYTNTEEGEILWDQFDEIQTTILSGFTASQQDYGFTRGTITASGNVRTKPYENDDVYKNLKQLVQLRDIGGNPQRVRSFRISPDLIDDSYLEVNYDPNGGTDRNVTYYEENTGDVEIEYILDDYANSVTVYGNGFTGVAAATDGEKDRLKLREYDLSAYNLTTQAAVDDRAEAEAENRAKIPETFSFDLQNNDPLVGLYRAGDNIKVKFADKQNLINIDKQVKVYKIILTWNATDKVESVSLDVRNSDEVLADTLTSGEFYGFENMVEQIKQTAEDIINISK